MLSIDVIEQITEFAKDYHKDASKSVVHTDGLESGEIIQQRHIDAILVDFINYVGIRYGIDYALYTEDLNKAQNDKKGIVFNVDILERVAKFDKDYRRDAAESVVRNNHMNELESGEIMQQRHIDVILAGFIKHISIKHGI